MKSYDEYKEINLPWLKEIPKHWGCERGKNLFHKEERPVSESDDTITCFRDGIVTLRKNRRTSGFTESLKEIGYQGIRKGDLVIHGMDAFAGAIGVSDSDGKGSPVYSVCTSKLNSNPYYYAYILREMSKKDYLQSLSRGIRERSSDFRFNIFAVQYLPVPTIDEQKQIVRYLDSKTAKINKLVQLKKKEVELLKEYRQAVITKAVTKGIHEGVKMKDSGVEWIGEIPEDWSVLPIKYYTKCNMRVLCEKTDADQPIKYIDISSVTSNGKIENIQELTFGKSPSRARRIVFENDIIISTVRTYLKAIAFISTQYSNYIVSTGFAVLTPDTNVCYPPYLYYALHIDGFINQIQRQSIGISYPSISSELLISFKNIIPSILEQKAITNYLDKKCSSIDKLISEKQSVIEKLSEYKTRLISDAVTGKIDVRDIKIEDSDFVEEDTVDYETDEEPINV